MPQAGQTEKARTRYNVLILGAGQIGAFYDAPGSANILTHAHAFSLTEGFQLVGFVDVDADKAKEAARIWNTGAFSSLKEAFASGPVDVVCLAVPDAWHYDALKEIAEYPVRLVFAEKPFCGDSEKAREIRALYEQKGIAIQVNYSRRFVPEFQALAKSIQSGEFGNCIGGSGLYGKGFVHNGSHMVNLLQSLFASNEIRPGQVFNRMTDWCPGDPSLSLQLVLPSGVPFTLQAVDSRVVTLFEFDLLFERKRVRMLKSGFLMYYFDTADNETFAGYRNYVMDKTVETSLGQALRFAAENIRDHLDNGATLLSPPESAIATLDILSLVKEKEAVCPS